MRILPIQMHMVHLSGEKLPNEDSSDTIQERAKRMRFARDVLVQETGHDFGYDVSLWHQYLISSQTSDDIRDEYTCSDFHEQFKYWEPNSDWQLAVDEAERLALENPNCPRCGSFAGLHKVAHGPPNAKELMWLCNACKYRMPV